MNFKKFNGTIWETVQHKVYGSGTDSLTAFPAMIQASGEAMTDYTIYGNTIQPGAPSPEAPVDATGCGVRTGNLFDENYTNISVAVQYRPIYVGSGNFTLSTTIPYDLQVANIFLLSGDVTSGASTSGNGAWLNHNVTAQSVDGYVTIAYRRYSGTTSPVECQSMLNTGSKALPYEPYGYKIPVTSGGVTTNLYTDSPLGLTDSLTYTDTGIALPTSDGDNIISFGTIVQPSAMSATFKGWHPVSSPKTYDGNDWS